MGLPPTGKAHLPRWPCQLSSWRLARKQRGPGFEHHRREPDREWRSQCPPSNDGLANRTANFADRGKLGHIGDIEAGQFHAKHIAGNGHIGTIRQCKRSAGHGGHFFLPMRAAPAIFRDPLLVAASSSPPMPNERQCVKNDALQYCSRRYKIVF
jgi:hypothetical protein